MQATSDMITCTKNKEHFETNARIELDGKSFEAMGSWIQKNPKTGLREGVLYVNTSERTVSTWMGDKKVPCEITNTYEYYWMGWLITNVYFRFTWDGVKYYGTLHNADFNQAARVREYKHQ